MPNSRNWGHPFYGDGKFIIADYSSEGIGGYATSHFAYSTDGINWTESTIRHNTGVSDYFYYIGGAYGNGLYVMAFSTSYGVPGIIYTSTDGINWSSGHSFYQQHNTIRKIFFDGNKFIACFDTSTTYPNALSYSTDGINWTDTGYLNMEYRFGDAVYNPDNQTYYAAVYQREGTTTKNQVIVSSSDLVNFTPIAATNYNNVAPITSCIINNEVKFFSGWSSLSQQSAGYFNIDSSGTATYVTSSIPRLNYQGGAGVINDRAVVIGYASNQYIYSTDGTTWNTGTLPASSGWWGSCVGEVD